LSHRSSWYFALFQGPNYHSFRNEQSTSFFEEPTSFVFSVTSSLGLTDGETTQPLIHAVSERDGMSAERRE
jgi:hypothetical protein